MREQISVRIKCPCCGKELIATIHRYGYLIGANYAVSLDVPARIES